MPYHTDSLSEGSNRPVSCEEKQEVDRKRKFGGLATFVLFSGKMQKDEDFKDEKNISILARLYARVKDTFGKK